MTENTNSVMRLPELSKLLGGADLPHIMRAVNAKNFPAPLTHLGAYQLGWDRQEIKAWIAEHEQAAKAAPAAPAAPAVVPDEIKYAVSEPTCSTIIKRYAEIGADNMRWFKTPFPLGADQLREATLRFAPYTLQANGLWEDNTKLADPIDVVYRGASLFTHCDGILVKFVVDGNLKLVPLPDPWLQGGGYQACERLEGHGLWIAKSANKRKALISCLRSVAPVNP